MLSFARQPDRLLPEGQFGLRLHVIVRASARPVTMEIVVLAPVFLMTAFGRTGTPFIVGASIARPLLAQNRYAPLLMRIARMVIKDGQWPPLRVADKQPLCHLENGNKPHTAAGYIGQS